MTLFSNFTTNENIFLFYLVSINISSFILFGIDKWRAKRHKWRISEFLLVFTSILGGASGALMGMSVFKHKSSKKKFYIGIPILIVFNWILAFYILNL